MRSRASHFLQTMKARQSIPITVPPRMKPSLLVFVSSSNTMQIENPSAKVVSAPIRRARHLLFTLPMWLLKANLGLLTGSRIIWGRRFIVPPQHMPGIVLKHPSVLPPAERPTRSAVQAPRQEAQCDVRPPDTRLEHSAAQLRECADTLGADQIDYDRAMRAYADSMALLGALDQPQE